MTILHLRSDDFKTALWSGGTTTELYLYPPTGSYAARDFLIRISSATVDLDESDFTPLPGVERFITPLEGSFTLSHPGVPGVKLVPLSAPYRFSGDIPTHCVGKATDFNIMLHGCQGHMQLRQYRASIQPGFNSFYPLSDGIISVENQEYPVKRGELLVIFSHREADLAYDGGNMLVCWAKV